MKKLISLFAALTAVLSMSATTLFLRTNTNWRTDNARFAIYINATEKWLDMTAVPGETNVFAAIVPEGTTKVTFVRMNPATTENNWTNKWNQTSALEIPFNQNLYTIAEGAWDEGDGAWSQFTATPAEGSLYLWNGIGSTSRATQLGGDSWVSKSDERVRTGAGMYGNYCLKINGDYANNYYIGVELKNGGVNAGDEIVLGDFRTFSDGTYRLGIKFYENVDASSPQASFETTADPQVLEDEGAPAQLHYTVPEGVSNATYLRLYRASGSECVWIAKIELIKKGSVDPPTPPTPEDPTAAVTGDMTGWAEDIPFILSEDKKTATLVVDKIPVGTYEFKMKINGEWRSNGQTFDRDHASATGISGNDANMSLVVDVKDEFTFTWTFETNALTVIFPEKPIDPPTPEEHTYTVAGNSEVAFGTEWAPTNTANDMIKQEDGSYKWEKTELTLPAGPIMFKVCEDHAWTVAYPGDNYNLSIPEAGVYTITITFTPAEDNKVDAVATKTGSADVDPTVAVKGSWDGWATALNFELSQDKKTATLTIENITAGKYEFKVILNEGDWRSNAQEFTRENASATGITGNMANMILIADIEGPYSFTWTFETNALSITFPTITGIEETIAEGKAVKVVRDGMVIIMKGDKNFNMMGQRVK